MLPWVRMLSSQRLCRVFRPRMRSRGAASGRGFPLVVQELEPRLACSVASLRIPDDFASGPTTKGIVRPGATRTGVIGHVGDRDWLAVTLVAGREYRFAANRTTLAAPDIVLRDAAGTALATGLTPPGGYDAQIDHRCTVSGKYFLDIGSATATGTGRYYASASDVTPSDDGVAGTSALGRVAVGGSVTGAVEISGDRDWFAIDLVARQPYRFRLSGGTLYNPNLYLRDADGAILSYNDDFSGRDSEIVFVPAAYGTFWLDAGARAGIGGYTLSVERASSGPQPGDDAGTDAAAAARLSVGGDALGFVNFAGDRDRFAIDLAAGRTYRFTVGSTDIPGLGATLFDGRGQVVVTADTGDRVEFSPTITLAGTYMLEVGAGRAATGSFKIACIDVTPGIDRIPGLRDAGIRSAVNTALADFVISRQEIVSLLTSATRGGSLSAQKLADLQTVALQAVSYVPDSRAAYEQFILNAVLLGNPANAWWTGGGSIRQSNLFFSYTKLVGKWYKGTDLPTNFVGGDSAANAKGGTFTYATASGPLFVDGVSYGDVDQGMAGTCYLLAAAVSIAATRPAAIGSMFLDNGDGTYGVRFFTPTQGEIWVTVNRQLPKAYGELYLAGNPERSLSGELWPALLEKAYAQANEMGFFGRAVAANSYREIEGGRDEALVHIGGGQRIRFTHSDESLYGEDSKPSDVLSEASANENLQTWQGFFPPAFFATIGGRSVYFGCRGDTTEKSGGIWKYNFVPRHAFSVIGYNPATEKFIFVNPWGSSSKDANHVFEESWTSMFVEASGNVAWTNK